MTPTIESLGDWSFRSSLPQICGVGASFKVDSDQIVCDDNVEHQIFNHISGTSSLTFEVADREIASFFDSAETTTAIVTCGGLCPGLR
jgi:6-phosphofructokinase 1